MKIPISTRDFLEGFMIHTGLQDKVAIVTGANHGIGAATARALAAQGARVFLTYLRLPPLGTPSEQAEGSDTHTPGLALYNFQRSQTAEEVIKQIRAQRGSVEALEADLTDLKTIPLLFDRAEATFGTVDILINNADHCVADTFLPPSQSEEAKTPSGYAPTFISAASHDAHFAINSRAVALMMAEFARRRIEQGKQWGRIINVSTDGSAGFVQEVSCGASKFALESYSRAAASELGRYGITVNIVSPGPIQTGYIAPELEQQLNAEIPLGRIGQPEDVADVVVFLASEQARWLTGQLLFVGGGHRMI
jgi:3-oxoacyl-[acyl-carrier protein] reductase